MSDRLKVFAGSSAQQFATAVCQSLDIGLGRAELTKYYNDCTFVRVEENVRGCDVFVVQTATAPVNDHLVELLMLINALKGASAHRVTAVIPFFFYGQSDQKDRGRISITARLVANLLEAAGADRVLTMDLHAGQIQGFMNCPTDQLTALPLLVHEFSRWSEVDTVVATTDVGRVKRVSEFAHRLGANLIIVDKERLDSEHVVARHIIGDPAGKSVVLFDDLIGLGGSMLEACRLLLDHGAKRVGCAAVHGVFARDAVRQLRASPLTDVVVTDTLPTAVAARGGKIRVVSVAALFAQAILRIHRDESVSELFQKA
ncbi:MAG: ribose-phosphate pyrophosphokinase [Chloroflexi bacterium]|nr:ribose-phosphate pyrophosphokinase [Chloroflexota bacterium]